MSARASARRGVNCSLSERSLARPAFSIRSCGALSDGRSRWTPRWSAISSTTGSAPSANGRRSPKIGMAAIVIALALAAAPLGWIARRFVYRDPRPDEAKPIAPCARRRLDICDLRRAAARRPRRAGRRARLLRPLRSEHAGRHRRRVRGGARADRRQRAWPRHARARACDLEARSGQRSVGGHPLSLGDDVCRDLGCRAVGRACGRRRRLAQSSRSPTRGVGAILAAIAIAYAMRQLGAQPTGAQGSPQSDAWAPLRTLGWAAALIIFLAAVTGYVAFATFLVNQAIYLSIVGAALYHRRHHRPGRNRSDLQAGWADWIAPAGDGGPAPQCARADLRHPARRRPCGGACASRSRRC